MVTLSVLKILEVTLFLSTFVHILGNEDVPPPPVDPCTTMNCEECEDHCFVYNCNCGRVCHNKRRSRDCHYQKEFVITRSCALAMLVASGVGVPLATGVLGLFGFAAVGVSSGSLAALWQSTMAGVVVKGGLFSLLQSIAAAGFSYSGVAIISGTTGAAMCGFCAKLGSLTGTDMKCSSQMKCM